MIAHADHVRRESWLGPPPPAGGWFGPLAAAGSSDALALTPLYGAGVDSDDSAAGTLLTLHAHFSRVAISVCDPGDLTSATRDSRAAAARSDRAHRRPCSHRTPPPRTSAAAVHRRRAPPPPPPCGCGRC